MSIAKNNFGKQQPEINIPSAKGFVKVVKVEHACEDKAQDLLDTIVSCLKLRLDKTLRSVLESANEAKIYFLFTDNSKLEINNGVVQYDNE